MLLIILTVNFVGIISRKLISSIYFNCHNSLIIRITENINFFSLKNLINLKEIKKKTELNFFFSFINNWYLVFNIIIFISIDILQKQ